MSTTTVTVSSLVDEIQQGRAPQMIDVRTPSEYAGGHIPCAINIPMDQFESRKKDLRLDNGVVLVCKGGVRAKIVAGWLPEGNSVRVLEGGTDAWINGNYEVVTSLKTRWSLERQVRLVAGVLILTGAGLALSGVHAAVWLALFVGAGLTFAGATDICPMGILLAKMPWNQSRTAQSGNLQNPCCGIKTP